MALIGKIRNNSALLIIVIGLGLAGFLVMDMNSASRLGGGLSQLVAGTVNGEKVRRNEFEATKQVRFSGGANRNTYQDGNTLWNWYVEDRLVKAEANALGLGLSGEEVIEMEFGPNYSPIVVQNFPNQQGIPGQPDKATLDAIKASMEDNTFDDQYGRLRPYWLMQRDLIKKDRLQKKLQGLVGQAMYTPSWMADMGHADQSQVTDFNFVQVTYDQIGNEEVALSDSDLGNYLSANAARYERKQEQRILDYVVFDVIPTSEDSTELRNGILELKDAFATAENGDSSFVLQYDGIISPGYFSADEPGLNGALKDTIMSLPAGTVYGPYVEDGEYKLVKVRSKLAMADTASSRHIYLSAGTPAEFETANERADSMINVLRLGTAQFDSLAIKFSADSRTASNGGELEDAIPNQSVPEGYNEFLFSTGRIGEIRKIRTDFGIFIAEVLSRSASTTERAQVAFVSEPIVPSEATITTVFQRASQFAADNGSLESMTAAANAASDLRVVSTRPFDNNAFSLGNLGFSQETKSAICWAFSASPGDVSSDTYSFTDPRRYYDNKYVVIALKDVLPAGTPSVDEIRETLEAEVLQEQKAAIVASRIQGKDLNGIAAEFGATVQTAAGVTFTQTNVTGVGAEPKVAAAAAGLAQGEQSSVIAGESGLFVIQATNKPALAQATNLPQVRQNLTNTAEGWISSSFVRLLRENADVEDNRSSFDCQ